jgi:formylglycine-generating enzyme required for sulfatase activity
MGSSPLDVKRAEVACQSEPLGAHCDDEDLRRQFLAEAPAHEVTLSPYAIDRTEVTVAAYSRCVAAEVCPPTTQGAHDPRFDLPSLPVTFVGWDAAVTFCTWAKGRLPTEAEWEFAARGAEERQYPWGNIYNSHLSNHGSFAADPTDSSDGFAGLAPVGSFIDGATPQGVMDLAGNVSEWVHDTFQVDEKGFGYDVASQVNPTGPKSGSVHIVRGGSYEKGAPWMRSTSRDISFGPSATVGFRCVADVR